MEEVKVKQVQAWETTGPEAQAVIVRESVVDSIVAGLRAAQLSQAELLAVVGVIHSILAAETTGKSATVVTATATTGYPVRASSRTVVRETMAPHLVSETVELLVREASPELWAEIRAVLEATDAQLAAMRAHSVAAS